MTMEEKRRVDEFSQLEVEVEDAVTIDGDLGPDEIPDRLWRVLDEDKKLKVTWEGERKDLNDESRSGHDIALAHLLIPYSFTNGEVAAI